jgi:hypothetical protein
MAAANFDVAWFLEDKIVVIRMLLRFKKLGVE